MAENFKEVHAEVKRLMTQNAPEQQIDAYLASKGYTPESYRAEVVKPRRDFGSPVLNTIANTMDIVVNPLETFGQKATDMMALGKLDEITALPGAIYDALQPKTLSDLVTGQPRDFGGAYAKRLSEQEARAKMLEERNPKAAIAGEITGVVTSPATQAGAKFINKGVSMGERAIRSLLPGGLTGTVIGAEGQNLGERAENALWTGAASTALSPIAQVGGELVGAGISKLFNWIRGRATQALPQVAAGKIDDPAAASVRKGSAPQEVSGNEMEAAARELWKRLEADGLNPRQVFDAITKGQMDVRTIAGIAGPNVRQMIDTYASMPGRAKGIVEGKRLAAEQGQTANIMKATGQTLGVKQSFTDLDDMLTAQKQQAGPLYDAFYKVSPDRFDTPFIQNLLKNPLSKELLATARTINQIEKAAGETPDDVFQYLLDAEGNVSTGQTLNPRAIDYVKRAIDQKVRENMDPLTGKVKGAVGVAWEKLRKAFVNHIDEVAPEFKAARDAFAGPASMEDAMEVGRKILRDDWIGNRKLIEEMTKSEKEALKVGAFQAVEDMLTGISNKADKAKRFADVEKYLDRLWPAFDSKKAFDAFKKSIMAQTAEFQAVQMAGKGSQTFPRAADDVLGLVDNVQQAGQAAGGDMAALLRAVKQVIQRTGAPSEGQRTAATALALTEAKQALPFMTAIQSRPDTRGLGLLASGLVPLPAREARGLLARPY
jgi:hypothetical protein